MRDPTASDVTRRVALRIVLLLYAAEPYGRDISIKEGLDLKHLENDPVAFRNFSNGHFLDLFFRSSEELIAQGIAAATYFPERKVLQNAHLLDVTCEKLDAARGSPEWLSELRDPCDLSNLADQPSEMRVRRLANAIGLKL